MPVVLPSSNLFFVASNEHHFPTPPISFRSCLSYLFSPFLSLSFPFPCLAYDASPEQYRCKAGSRKRRITKSSVTAGGGHRVYSLSRSVYPSKSNPGVQISSPLYYPLRVLEDDETCLSQWKMPAFLRSVVRYRTYILKFSFLIVQISLDLFVYI